MRRSNEPIPAGTPEGIAFYSENMGFDNNGITSC
jgi:hypothetical protein